MPSATTSGTALTLVATTGSAGEHRLEQDDPEALPAGRVHEDVGALEPVADLGAAGQRDRVLEAEFGDERARLAPPAGRRRGSRAVPPEAPARTSANARSSVAWSFCSIRRPTASASGASAGIPGLPQVSGSDGAAGSSSRP